MNGRLIRAHALLALAALLTVATPVLAGYVVDGVIFHNNAGGIGDGSYYDAGTQTRVSVFTHNDLEVDPMLLNPYGNPYGLIGQPNNKNPQFIPRDGSPALGWVDDVVNIVHNAAECSQDGCRPNLQTVCYRGAIPPVSQGYDWTVGWIYNNFDGAGRTDINYGKPLVNVSGDITTNTTWVSTNNYLLVGKVRVMPPATLTIQPGTVVFGQKSTIGFLSVERGAKIDAQGTASAPIIFTSDQAPGSMAPGDYGGLVISGYGIANCADCLGGQSCVSEGSEILHCGTNDCDDSGVLRYVRVEYAGNEVAPNNELNAFTWNSVGAYTRIEYCNAFRGSDDLFEWFGGAVTCKYLVGMGGLDDGLDWQMGFRGGCQFAVIQQWGDGASDKAIEADNNEFNYNAACRSNPVMANLTLVNTNSGGTASTHGIHLRRGTDGQIYNSIVMGWNQGGIRIQHAESAQTAYADPGVSDCGRGYVVDGVIFHNNTGGAYYDAGTTSKVSVFPHNDTNSDPQLAAAYNTTSPNWVPAASSPAVAGNDVLVYPVVHRAECAEGDCLPSMTPTCWRGALAPASIGPNWTQGWIYTNFDGSGRTDINYGKPLVNVSGDITTNTTWVSTNNYLLVGKVRVMPPATLTIQPGTVVFGQKSTIGFLSVERGAKIDAQGTASAPIIFTSDQAPGSMAPGDYGGLVISGYGIANCADCLGGQSCVSEGSEILHCGTNDCDDSGVLRYVRVEYAGNEVAPNNELNAFTWNSVGAYTRIEYCNAFRGSDDLFEWFGGAVTCKYLVGMGGLDDGLDWQMGFRGGCQFAVIQQWGDGASDKAIEADNNEFNYNAACRSNPVMANLTLVNTNSGGTATTHGIHLRRGTDAQIYNSIVMGWNQGGIRIQHAESCASPYPAPPVFCNGGNTSDVTPAEIASSLEVRTFPNPVAKSATFQFSLPSSGHARLAVFDINGREVASLVDRDLNAGLHEVDWSLPGDSPAGAYFYRMEASGQVTTGRLVTVR